MVTGVILAAGQAKRMGQAKQLLLLGGKPMVWQVASTACQANFHEVIVITGAYREEVTQALRDLPVKIIYNEQWALGQSSSVKKAIQSVNQKSQAVAFLLADQPLIDARLMNEVIARYQETKSSIVMPRVQQQPGNPVLFDLLAWRSALLQLSGDEGARQMIRKHQGEIQYIEGQDAEVFLDVDTPASFEVVKKKWYTMKG